MLNHFAINGGALNADVLDNTIRTLVNSYARAYITVTPRVLGYLKVTSNAKAQASGTLGFVREPGYLYTPITSSPSAQIVHKPKVLMRHALNAAARASIALTGMAIANPVRAAVTSNPSAQVTVKARTLLRNALTSQPRVQAAITPRVLRRQPVQSHPRAQVVVNTNVIRLGVFDKPAIAEYTFTVPFCPNKFTVGNDMRIATIEKQPRDVRDYDINFGDSEWGFPDGDVITSVQVTADKAGMDLTYAYSGLVAKIWAGSGTDKVTYKVTVLATTNNGRAQEVELIFKVKDR